MQPFFFIILHCSFSAEAFSDVDELSVANHDDQKWHFLSRIKMIYKACDNSKATPSRARHTSWQLSEK